jgi:hypothetical protein
MTALNRSTRRRLQQLQQIPSVWEGDRRPLSAPVELEDETKGDCILWVDGSQGVVRAMDMVAPDTGPEAVVRTLLRAMEHPQGPVPPGRPQKIVVRDREIQFYLRGILQELDITIDRAPSLPLIDELFREFEESVYAHPPQLPPQYAEKLQEEAYKIWQNSPWKYLAEHQILSIELNQWDIGTLYGCVMGMSGMEYGILLYRSLESLKRFRAAVIHRDDSIESLEEAFLGQDCLFITFEPAGDRDEDEDEDIDLAELPISLIEPSFGNIHPLEGLRSSLYEEEAVVVLVALEALNRFFRASRRKLAGEEFPSITSRYRIPSPDEPEATAPLSVKVTTLPKVAEELYDMVQLDEESDDATEMPPLRDDLVPQNSFLSIGMVPWEMVEYLRTNSGSYQGDIKIQAAGDGLPVILIQTSRPKAKMLIEKIQAAGGLKGILFNPGEDPFEETRYDIGIIQTNNGEMHLFGEFVQDEPVHVEARKRWDQRCKKTKGYCGLVIAKGLTGASRGNPQMPDMMALFEARSLSGKELGLGTLQRIVQLDFD